MRSPLVDRTSRNSHATEHEAYTPKEVLGFTSGIVILCLGVMILCVFPPDHSYSRYGTITPWLACLAMCVHAALASFACTAQHMFHRAQVRRLRASVAQVWVITAMVCSYIAGQWPEDGGPILAILRIWIAGTAVASIGQILYHIVSCVRYESGRIRFASQDEAVEPPFRDSVANEESAEV